MPEPLRLGSIGFVNSLPVDWGLASGAVPADLTLRTDTPARLNELLLSGELDVSPVSAYWYAQHARELALLPGLSISTQSIVMSVLLFSRRPPHELRDRVIRVSAQGRTTPALLEVLCRRHYRFIPTFELIAEGPDPLAGDSEAVMLIGDQALIHRERARRDGWIVTDLAQEWQRWTELPFVFAVWAVRRDVLSRRRGDVEAAHASILASREWGLSHPGAVLERAAEATGLDGRTLRDYFSRLSYDFTQELQNGLIGFYRQAARCGLLAQAPELSFAFEEAAEPSPDRAVPAKEVA